MSKFSNLFTAGIFIIFFAILFHYFCRVRKKPDMVIQQVQVSDGYVYPITPNVNGQQMPMGVGPNYVDQRFSVPYPLNFPVNSGPPYPYPYPTTNAGSPGVTQPTDYRQNATQFPPGYPQQFPYTPATPNHPPPNEDLPPPYHTVVSSPPHPH